MVRTADFESANWGSSPCSSAMNIKKNIIITVNLDCEIMNGVNGPSILNQEIVGKSTYPLNKRIEDQLKLYAVAKQFGDTWCLTDPDHISDRMYQLYTEQFKRIKFSWDSEKLQYNVSLYKDDLSSEPPSGNLHRPSTES